MPTSISLKSGIISLWSCLRIRTRRMLRIRLLIVGRLMRLLGRLRRNINVRSLCWLTMRNVRRIIWGWAWFFPFRATRKFTSTGKIQSIWLKSTLGIRPVKNTTGIARFVCPWISVKRPTPRSLIRALSWITRRRGRKLLSLWTRVKSLLSFSLMAAWIGFTVFLILDWRDGNWSPIRLRSCTRNRTNISLAGSSSARTSKS